MKNTNLNKTTKQVLYDLIDNIEEMLILESNIEVVWKLENLSQNKALSKSADLIRKSLNKKYV